MKTEAQMYPLGVFTSFFSILALVAILLLGANYVRGPSNEHLCENVFFQNWTSGLREDDFSYSLYKPM